MKTVTQESMTKLDEIKLMDKPRFVF